MQLLPSEEYYKSLPKKQMGSGILLFNDKNELLIVKATYKDKWTIPGGVVDADESPRQCVIRETKEELGLNIKEAKFICIDYKETKDYHLENMQVMFYGGILSNEELSKFRFVSTNEALELLRPNPAKRLPHCLKAIKTGKAVYLEEGEVK